MSDAYLIEGQKWRPAPMWGRVIEHVPEEPYPFSLHVENSHPGERYWAIITRENSDVVATRVISPDLKESIRVAWHWFQKIILMERLGVDISEEFYEEFPF